MSNFSFYKKPSSLCYGSSNEQASVLSAQHDNGITVQINVHKTHHKVVHSATSTTAFHCPLRMKMVRLRRHHFYRPYDFPWRPALEASLRQCWTVDTTLPTNVALVLPECESANKSNPGSPVKGYNDGAIIPRSRSLDDLKKDEMSNNCSREAEKTEIDSVSQQISELHVGEPGFAIVPPVLVPTTNPGVNS